VARGRTSISQQPQFKIAWRDVDTVAPDLVTGMTEEEAARASRTERPLMVYVYDAEDDGAQYALEEDAAFGDEKVAVGARFFACLRIAAGDAAKDRVLKPYAAKAPCIVFVRPAYEATGVQRAKFSANRIFQSMCATLKKDYRNCAETVLKKQREIERDRASLQRDRDRLAKLDEEIADTGAASRRARLNEERDELAAKLNEAEGKLAEQEAALYVLEPKEAPASS